MTTAKIFIIDPHGYRARGTNHYSTGQRRFVFRATCSGDVSFHEGREDKLNARFHSARLALWVDRIYGRLTGASARAFRLRARTLRRNCLLP